MPATISDIYKILDQIDHHHRAITALNTELRSMLAAGVAARKPADILDCPDCGIPMLAARLTEHRYTVHDVGRLCPECGQPFIDAHECPLAA